MARLFASKSGRTSIFLRTAAARREDLNAACNSRLRKAVSALVVMGVCAMSVGSLAYTKERRDALKLALRRPPDVKGTAVISIAQALPGEKPPPLVEETVQLTGAPPLVVWSDRSVDGNPDFDHRGAPVTTSFKIVNPDAALKSAGGGDDVTGARAWDNVYQYTVKSEDAIKDIFIATLSSPGKRRGSDPRVSCKASPVTAKWLCRAALTAAFGDEAKTPPLWILDAGSTSAGYYGLLAASHGIPSLLIEPQPHCAYWGRLSAEASGAASLIHQVTAFPDGPRSDGSAYPHVPVPVRMRSGCIGTSSIDWPPTAEQVAAAYRGADGGLKLTDVPRKSIDEIVADPGSGVPKGALFLVVKVDASGREDDVLRGMSGMLASKRALSVIVEINKQHLARRFGLGTLEGGGDASSIVRDATKGKNGYDPAPFPRQRLAISDGDNAILGSHIAGLVRSMFAHGYEMLTADRGWWAAQDPYNAATDAQDPSVLDTWAQKVMKHGEMDLWFYLPDRMGPGGEAL